MDSSDTIIVRKQTASPATAITFRLLGTVFPSEITTSGYGSDGFPMIGELAFTMQTWSLR